jgi:hypothetical protein
MEKIKLPSVTLIAVAGNKQAETIVSMYKSMSKVDFAAVKLITNIELSASGIEVIKVDGLKTWGEYNHFIIKELYKYFDTDYCLICQWDSWVLDAEQWDNRFLDFDIVGAKWLYTDGRNVANGGFTLRSRYLQETVAKDDFISVTTPEDEILGRLYRHYLEEKYGIKYCTEEIADKFAFELHEPLHATFGFHAFHRQPYKETVVIKRSGALGDVIMAEPLLEYYHKKGYRVALDTQDEFMKVYSQHHFPVYPKSYLHSNLPYKEINLDMSYEIKPKQPVLQSYFEMAGITDYELRNSRLNLRSGGNEKLFPKYAIIHIDSTGMEYRNQHNIDWKKVVLHLENKGFQVFQIGRRIDVQVAPLLNTMNLEFMMFIVKGADLFIGLDSGVAQVAVGFNVASIIFFGSVSAKYRYNNFDKIRIIQSNCPSESKKNCYHEENGRVIGSECVFNIQMPPCACYSADMVINEIKTLI